MIRMERASAAGWLQEASLAAEAGDTCAVLADSDETASRFVRLLAGLEPLASGSLHILGKDLANLSNSAMYELRTRIGVVMRNGGLISNLKLWENIVLPVCYHGLLSENEAEERLAETMRRVGFEEDLARLPETVSAEARKMAGLMRAMLMRPEIMLYDAAFDGLKAESRSRLVESLGAFHGERAGRLSVFVQREDKLPEGLSIRRTFVLQKGFLHERNRS